MLTVHSRCASLVNVPVHQLVFFALVQGVGTGVVSTLGYAVVIDRFGASAATLVTALTPAVVAVLSALVFHEPLTGTAIIGLLLVLAGIGSRAGRRRGKQRTTAGIAPSRALPTAMVDR